MKRTRIGFGLLLNLAAIVFLFGFRIVPFPTAEPPMRNPMGSEHAARQQLSHDGQLLLRRIAEGGELPEMRWPSFHDYRGDASKFYEAYNFDLPWVSEMRPTQQAIELIALFQSADKKGLSPDDYDGPRWSERIGRLKPATAEPNESDAIRFDVAMTVSAMRYISDLHVGKINPKHLHFEVDVEERRYNLPEFLKEHVVSSTDVPREIGEVEPQFPGYQRTIRALNSYMRFAREDDGEILQVPKRTVEPGDRYPGVARVWRLLSLVGDIPAGAAAPSGEMVYQGALVEGVKRFQQEHGLKDDGWLGARTVAELNVPLSYRVRQMQLTLERWRWMPGDYQRSPIVVNIPEFRLRAYDDQFRIGATMNVVVGKAIGHDTPAFMREMRYVIFRPYWEVPLSIAEEEILPAIESDPDYMVKENLEIVDGHGNPAESGAATPEMLQEVREEHLFIRQKPGPKNSLGLVKFMFPNRFGVYMHDTPATILFSKSRRDFSHGCIRLEKPAELAAWVLRNNPGWTSEHIQAAMNGDETVRVNLEHSIPVLIVYGTVVVSEDGVVHFYSDIYRHDAALNRALKKGYPYPR